MNAIGDCPNCGDIPLTINKLTVRVCVENDERVCTYRCPQCGAGNSLGLCRTFSQHLVNSGALLVFWRWPLELREQHHGLPIGYGDVNLFCRGLKENDRLSELAMR